MAYTKEDKNKLLVSLEKNLSNVTLACRSTGIHRQTYYLWLREDEEFKSATENIRGVADDYVESQLMKAIRDNNIPSIHFYLKSRHNDYKPKLEQLNINYEIDNDKSEEEIDMELERIGRVINQTKET